MQYWFIEVTRTKYRDGMKISNNVKTVTYEKFHKASNNFSANVASFKRDGMTLVNKHEEEDYKCAVYACVNNGIVTVTILKLWTRVYNDALKETLKKFPYPILRDAYKALGINWKEPPTGNVIKQSTVDEDAILKWKNPKKIEKENEDE